MKDHEKEQKYTVLLLSADPKKQYALDLAQEFKLIKKVHESSKYRKHFIIKSFSAVTYKDLRHRLISDKPSIIHFCGHGIGKKGLILVDEEGKEKIIDTETLADLFKICQKENNNISCVIFNACYGEFQAKAIQKYIKYVIGMTHEIKDDHAIYFAEAFYDSLFTRTKIETAFELGRNAIRQYFSQKSVLERAKYAPAHDDERVATTISDYEIPELIVNEDLEDILFSDNIITSEKNRVLNYEQWKSLEKLLSNIDIDILKNICRETLKEDIKNIKSEISPIKNLVDLKHLLLESYPTHKDNESFTILEFVERLTQELTKQIDISDELEDRIEEQQVKLEECLINIAKEKNITLPILAEEIQGKEELSETLNSHLLITFIPRNDSYEEFTLEAEYIDNYQEGKLNYEHKLVEYDLEEIHKIKYIENINPEAIETYLSEIIEKSIKQFSIMKCKPIIELFLPYEYLGKAYDKCKLPYGIKRKKKFIDLGVKYKLSLRSLDRYEDRDLFIEHNENWQNIKEKFDGENFYKIYLEDDVKNFIDEFTDTGIPIAIWIRTLANNIYCINGNNHTPETIEKELRELVKISSIEELTQIIKRVYEERKKDYEERKKDCNKNSQKKYLGYYLGLISDNPERIPSHYFKEYYYQGTN